jgi:hypothetical protein
MILDLNSRRANTEVLFVLIHVKAPDRIALS